MVEPSSGVVWGDGVEGAWQGVVEGVVEGVDAAWRASMLRGAADRNSPLRLDQQGSMGFMSGEQAGR